MALYYVCMCACVFRGEWKCMYVCTQKHSQVSSRTRTGPKSTLSLPQSPSTLLIETSLSKTTKHKTLRTYRHGHSGWPASPEIPRLPFRALHCMSARDPNPVLTDGAISAVPVSYTCECEQALCLRVSTHACIPWNQRSTSGSGFWLSSTLFFETKFLTYLELTN